MKYENEYWRLRKIYKDLNSFTVIMLVILAGAASGVLFSWTLFKSPTAILSVFLKHRKEDQMQEELTMNREEYFKKEIPKIRWAIFSTLLRYAFAYLVSASLTIFLIYLS